MDKVKSLREKGQKVCLVSMDASSAFDLVSFDLILGSLERLGVGPLMLQWIKSFLNGCSLSVKIDDSLSTSWQPDIGVGQGRCCSPDFYNVASLTAVFWCILLSPFVGFADDTIDVIAGSTVEE